MILYHGSNVIVEHPDQLHTQRNLDFGAGFYTTSIPSQAEQWAKRKALFHGDQVGYVSIYEGKEAAGFKIMDFGEDLSSWIDFVCDCRNGSDAFQQYDVIKGKVANDKVFRVVDMYKRGIWDKEKTLKEFRIYETYDQIAYISQKAIDTILVFKGSYEVKL